MKDYKKVDGEYGVPIAPGPAANLFLSAQKERAEQIMKAVEGLHVCTALCLLEKCKEAVMQSTVDVD